MLKIDYIINESKINTWLDELDGDRKKIFDDIKMSKSSEKVKEDKIYKIESIQRSLLQYKKLLTKEKADNEKY
jgi:hypothetical protein